MNINLYKLLFIGQPVHPGVMNSEKWDSLSSLHVHLKIVSNPNARNKVHRYSTDDLALTKVNMQLICLHNFRIVTQIPYHLYMINLTIHYSTIPPPSSLVFTEYATSHDQHPYRNSIFSIVLHIDVSWGLDFEHYNRNFILAWIYTPALNSI